MFDARSSPKLKARSVHVYACVTRLTCMCTAACTCTPHAVPVTATIFHRQLRVALMFENICAYECIQRAHTCARNLNATQRHDEGEVRRWWLRHSISLDWTHRGEGRDAWDNCYLMAYSVIFGCSQSVKVFRTVLDRSLGIVTELYPFSAE